MSDTSPTPHEDPQTHLDSDPVNQPAPDPETDLAGNPREPVTESGADDDDEAVGDVVDEG